MKIKSLLLGSAVAMGMLATGPAFAADALGVLTTLNVCDQEGVSGLTIASDTNCLKISGEVSFEMEHEFDFDQADWDNSEYSAGVEWEITFDAVNGTDFGPAHAVITLEGENSIEWDNGDDEYESTDSIGFSEAYVSIGDATVIAAGLKDSISDDLTTEGLTAIFNSETSGLGADGLEVGDVGISIVHQFGDGFSAGAALEALTEPHDPPGADDRGRSFVGFVAMEQEMFSGHVAFAYSDIFDFTDPDPDWEVDTGFGLELDMFELAAGIWFDENMSWEAVLSAAVDLDVATLAGELYIAEDSPEWDDQDGHIATVSAEFEAMDGVEIAIAGIHTDISDGEGDEHGDDLHGEWGGLIEVTVELSETLELVAAAEGWAEGIVTSAPDNYFEGSLELTWDPDGSDNFEASALVGVSNAHDGEFFFETSVEKSFE